MYEAKTMQCKFCGKPTTYLGTKMCNSCWEVERNLDTFIKSENGLKHTLSLIEARDVTTTNKETE